MSSWIAFLVTLSLIILVHEWGHFVIARRIGVKVERFSFGFGPVLLRWRRGQTDYALSLLPFGGYVKLAGESEEVPGPVKAWEYRARSIPERMGIVFAGPLVNYLLGFLLFFIVFMVGSPVYTSRIGRVIEDYPAQAADLRPGDRIVAVDGQPVKSWEEMTRAIQIQTRSVTLTVEREGRRFQQTIEPKVTQRKAWFGPTRPIAQVGIAPSDEVEVQRYPPVAAFFKAAHQVWFLTRITLQALWTIATGGLSLRETVTGPIGIFYITATVAQQGLISLLQLIAVLSTSIGLFNLLPVPVLDGGHLAFLAAEWLRGRPLSVRIQEAMTRVGLGFLLLLLAVVTYNDLLRFDIGGRVLSFFSGR